MPPHTWRSSWLRTLDCSCWNQSARAADANEEVYNVSEGEKGAGSERRSGGSVAPKDAGTPRVTRHTGGGGRRRRCSSCGMRHRHELAPKSALNAPLSVNPVISSSRVACFTGNCGCMTTYRVFCKQGSTDPHVARIVVGAKTHHQLRRPKGSERRGNAIYRTNRGTALILDTFPLTLTPAKDGVDISSSEGQKAHSSREASTAVGGSDSSAPEARDLLGSGAGGVMETPKVSAGVEPTLGSSKTQGFPPQSPSVKKSPESSGSEYSVLSEFSLEAAAPFVPAAPTDPDPSFQKSSDFHRVPSNHSTVHVSVQQSASSTVPVVSPDAPPADGSIQIYRYTAAPAAEPETAHKSETKTANSAGTLLQLPAHRRSERPLSLTSSPSNASCSPDSGRTVVTDSGSPPSDVGATTGDVLQGNFGGDTERESSDLLSQPSIADPFEMETGYLNGLYKEIKYLHTEERLVKAWLTAQYYLRRVQKQLDYLRSSAEQSRDTDALADKFTALKHKLMASAFFPVLNAKFTVLQSTLGSFGLGDRFDLKAASHSFEPPKELPQREDFADFPAPELEPQPAAQIEQHDRKSGKRVLPRIGRKWSKKFSSHREQPRRQGSHLAGSNPSSSKMRFWRPKMSRELSKGPPLLPEVNGGGAPKDDAPWTEEKSKSMRVAHRYNANGTLGVRVRAKVGVPLFRALAILNETDYYDKWVPYCKKCFNLQQTSRCSMLLRQICDYPWPIKQKEALSYCYGVDTLEEFGSVLIVSCSPPETATDFMGCRIPPPEKKLPRVASSVFLFILTPVDQSAVVLECYATVDPGVSALRSVILPVVRVVVSRSVRGFYGKIVNLATNFAGSPYEKRVQENHDFYSWIEKRIREDLDQPSHRVCSLTTLQTDDVK